MEIITAIAVIALAAKVGTAIVSVVGIASGVNWFNKKTFTGKKGGGMHESHIDSERFSRHDL